MGYVRTAALAVGLNLTLLVSSALVSSASAQIDYRNLDDERPVTTEDAYPIERYAWELLGAYGFEQERGGEQIHRVPLELAHGVFSNTQVGFKAPLAAIDHGEATNTDWGLAGLGLFGLYNFNTESPTLPALALRADASIPVGALAGDAVRFSLKAIATRSWGRTRVHLNAARGFGPEEDLAEVEALPRWRYSVATDYTLYRESVLFVGEILTARLVSGAPVEVNAAIGTRYQWSPTLVLDVGVARRLREEVGPDLALTIGVSHTFGFGWRLPSHSR